MRGSIGGIFAPIIKAAALAAHPVGSIYLTMTADNPALTIGGTWTRICKGYMLVGVNEIDPDFKTPGKYGGEKVHYLTESEMPAHRHDMEYTTDSGATWTPAGASWGRYSDVAQSVNELYHGVTNKVENYTAWWMRMSTAGEGTAHNNMPPYVACYMWQRIA